MSPHNTVVVLPAVCFPRVSGDEPAFSWIQEHKDLVFPA